MSHMIPNHVLRVGQTIRLDSAQETGNQHPSLTKPSGNHDDSDLDISLDNLNQLILELDPTFEPLQVDKSPLCIIPPTADSCSDEEVSHCVLVPRGCSSSSSLTMVQSVSPSIPIPSYSKTGGRTNGMQVFSSSPTCFLPPLPCGSAPRRNASPKHDTGFSQGSLLSNPNRHSVASLLSMSTCSDTSYILGSNLSLASEDADSPESMLSGTSGSFSDCLYGYLGFQARFNGSLPSMKFVMDTSKFWFRPHMSRAEAEALVKGKEAGTFVVRDSTSYRGSFGLAMKVDQTPSNFTATAYPGESTSDAVRHFLIESSTKGVRIKGASQEPYFGSLSALVYQHTISAYALPCKLLLHSQDLGTAEERANDKPASEDQGKTACNFIYLNAVPTETLTGPCAVQKAVSSTFQKVSGSFIPTIVNMKVSLKGVTLTDINRKLFFRRHYPVHLLSYSGEDPDNRLWVKGSTHGARMFGFVAKGIEAGMENVCHVFAEYDPLQPSNKVMEVIQAAIAKL
ncbi:putative tensin-4 [Scophthalmus maximus]|uniref:Putative tensin-4 n=1 Tax=Scophthalmus maximus TaxID=52904 RepID=A0A2U9BQ00_SCOMX|nr:putative tensin-4 [Scophthalmus maximus]